MDVSRVRMRLIIVVMNSTAVALSQVQPVAAPSFGAASIKLNRTGNNGRQSMTPGRISFSSVALKECLMAAYDIRDYQIVGPASSSSDRYDIVGTADGPASNPELRAMLKTLLA